MCAWGGGGVCVRACVRVCVRVCMRVYTILFSLSLPLLEIEKEKLITVICTCDR